MCHILTMIFDIRPVSRILDKTNKYKYSNIIMITNVRTCTTQ